MADPETETEKDAPKGSKKPLILGAVAALVLGAGGFYAVYSGLIPGGGGGHDTHAQADGHGGHGEGEAALADIAFVPVDPLIITLGPQSQSRHLRFKAQLEVAPAHQVEVTTLMPRVLDVLNSYLRAVDVAELEDPAMLITLRAQMLRRVQLVTGPGRVRDLLVTEFVLN